MKDNPPTVRNSSNRMEGGNVGNVGNRCAASTVTWRESSERKGKKGRERGKKGKKGKERERKGKGKTVKTSVRVTFASQSDPTLFLYRIAAFVPSPSSTTSEYQHVLHVYEWGRRMGSSMVPTSYPLTALLWTRPTPFSIFVGTAAPLTRLRSPTDPSAMLSPPPTVHYGGRTPPR